MIFIRHVQAGVSKDFQTYRSYPKKVLPFLVSFLFSCIIFINAKVDSESCNIVYNDCEYGYFEIPFIAPIFWFVLSEMIHDRQTNMKKFIMMNGMSKAAYIIYQFIANFILTIPVIVSQVYILYYFMGQDALVIDQRELPEVRGQMQSLIVYYFIANIATISLALLISRFSMVKQATGITLIVFLVFPILNYWIDLPYYLSEIGLVCTDEGSAAFYTFSLINPNLIRWRIDNIFQCDKWKAASFITLTIILFYICLYIFFEWLAEWRKMARGARSKKNKVQISMAQMDQQTNLLIEELENPEMPTLFFEEKVLSENMPMIGVENVTKSFKGMKDLALDDINLKIYEKEIFCLIGHNGAGKTTLLNIITGLISKTKGSIFYENEEVNSAHIRKSIGFCTQENLALTENTVYQNLIFIAKLRIRDISEITLRVEEVMNKLDLAGLKDKIACDLSPEQRKKLSIAIALLNNPQVIIMDEPTSGLDVITRRVVWQIIKELKENGKTVIFTTQFLDDAEELANRLAILSKGKIILFDEC